MPRTCIRDPRARLEARSVRTPTGCIEWTGTRDRDGYGKTSLNSVDIRTHRLAWILQHGEVPEGFLVCHVCDNPPCVNVEHLWLGTAADNSRDREVKGRSVRSTHGKARGERHPNSKLTEAQVLAIIKDDRSLASIAADWGVTKQAVHAIKKGKTWGWLDG